MAGDGIGDGTGEPPRRRRRGGIALFVVALVVVGVCVRLGVWQLDRLEGRRDANARIRAGLAAPVVALGEALDGGTDPRTLAWRHARVDGTYDPTEELILYGRAQDGRPGDHVLTPLVLDDGTAVLVDRGWVPFEPEHELPVPGAAAAPTGPVSVSGVLLPAGDEPMPTTSPSPRPSSAPVTTVQRIDLPALQAQMPYPLAPVALLLQEQRPAQGGLPEPATLPELDEGPHLAYAVQWFVFAAIALVGYGLLATRARREARRG
jgi:surfeit locus 1 family protein